jgi:hypothetical protein
MGGIRARMLTVCVRFLLKLLAIFIANQFEVKNCCFHYFICNSITFKKSCYIFVVIVFLVREAIFCCSHKEKSTW